MAALDGGTLALVLFLGLATIVLVLVGISNIRSGRRGLPPDPPLAWHEIPRVLFGLNNIVFACLLLFILLLILFTGQMMRSILFALVVLTIIISIALLTRSLLVSLRQPTRLREHERRSTPDEAGAGN